MPMSDVVQNIINRNINTRQAEHIHSYLTNGLLKKAASVIGE